jgi:ABC-2 type transport system permease protein
MKQFFLFVRKEFAHVLRDRKTLFILFGMPVMQILIFGFALTNEIKNANILIIDQGHDLASRQLIGKIKASRYFEVYAVTDNEAEVEKQFKAGNIKLALIIAPALAKAGSRSEPAKLQVIADAADPNIASQLTNYLSLIISDYASSGKQLPPMQIIPEVRMLYNPQLKGAHNFVPGVMALVLILVCVMMTAISIVKEKETGTMEILLVSPFKPVLVIISKAVPYFFLSIVNVTSIVLLSVFVLDLPVNGSLILLFAESALFITTCLTLGIFISIKAQTQQVAMLISLMGMLLPTMLFSGFMFPIENMPIPLQVISNIVPSKWFYIIVKSIMIKGLGFAAIWKETLILGGITLFFFAVSIRNFKIRLA